MMSNKKRSKRNPNTRPKKLSDSSAAPANEEPKTGSRGLLLLVSALGFCILAGLLSYVMFSPESEDFPRSRRRARNTSPRETNTGPRTSADTRSFTRGNLTMVWDSLTPDVLSQITATSVKSNIRPEDYAGAETCIDCHKENHADWSEHSHRWMNAVADAQTVKASFAGETISYRGGTGTFFKVGQEYRMKYERHASAEHKAVNREYLITQTIGSRFYQYYVGKGVQGPEPPEHSYYMEDFVLPFGFWLERQVWVPIVHVDEEKAEGERWESIESLKPSPTIAGMEGVGRSRGVVDHSSELGLVYARSCNYCHTTFPLGEMLIRNPKLLGPSLPNRNILEMSNYIADTHPELWDGTSPPETLPADKLQKLSEQFINFDAREYATNLGISCEACHLGCEQHVSNEDQPPAFQPQSPHLHEFTNAPNIDAGKNHVNSNAACARCHVGNRPSYAGGMSTWNSTELSDALKGSCYSELSCVRCHDPHKAIGSQWTKTPAEDDASCLSCHEDYNDAEFRLSHTHHPAGSEGDRCMNCHMPKINEGMQDVVRTHTIFSPTQAEMLEANHPNACNLCHLDKNTDWTLSYLRTWYGKYIDPGRIQQGAVPRSEPVGVQWLLGEHEATRLVAAEAAATQEAKWLLPQLLEMLDDPYLLNRQFAQKSVESLAGVELPAEYQYWYYMTKSERAPAIQKLKSTLLK